MSMYHKYLPSSGYWNQWKSELRSDTALGEEHICRTKTKMPILTEAVNEPKVLQRERKRHHRPTCSDDSFWCTNWASPNCPDLAGEGGGNQAAQEDRTTYLIFGFFGIWHGGRVLNPTCVPFRSLSRLAMSSTGGYTQVGYQLGSGVKKSPTAGKLHWIPPPVWIWLDGMDRHVYQRDCLSDCIT